MQKNLITLAFGLLVLTSPLVAQQTTLSNEAIETDEGFQAGSEKGPNFDLSAYFGLGKYRGKEFGVLAGFPLLDNPIPLALEIGLARAQWPESIVKLNRFSLTTDVRWSLQISETFMPYLAAGLRYDRLWYSAGDYESAAEGVVKWHGKFGVMYQCHDLFAIRGELDPSLEMFRLGLQFNF